MDGFERKPHDTNPKRKLTVAASNASRHLRPRPPSGSFSSRFLKFFYVLPNRSAWVVAGRSFASSAKADGGGRKRKIVISQPTYHWLHPRKVDGVRVSGLNFLTFLPTVVEARRSGVRIMAAPPSKRSAADGILRRVASRRRQSFEPTLKCATMTNQPSIGGDGKTAVEREPAAAIAPTADANAPRATSRGRSALQFRALDHHRPGARDSGGGWIFSIPTITRAMNTVDQATTLTSTVP